MEGSHQFSKGFKENLLFLVFSNEATYKIILKFALNLFKNPGDIDMTKAQRLVIILFHLASTSPEKNVGHWNYATAVLIDCPTLIV